jgi:2,3-bisphosphoglycerate-independent phosphoglycerate mutase
MSAKKLTDELVNAIRSRDFDTIICNFANGDMVGHTGVFEAAVIAVETLDECLGRIEAALLEAGGQMLITADHGNVEQMNDLVTGQPHTAHTSQPVPLVYVGPQDIELSENGTLSDIAPTLLQLMHMDPPVEMTGKSIATINEPRSAEADA